MWDYVYLRVLFSKLYNTLFFTIHDSKIEQMILDMVYNLITILTS
jgi:hypothetical protein